MDELDLAAQTPIGLTPVEAAPLSAEVLKEPQSSDKGRASLVLGMRKREVRQRYGDPDNRRSDKGGVIERWNYGRSVIVFEGEVVSAWIDSGDLEVRSLVPRRKRRAFERDEEFALEGWKNVWNKEEAVHVESAEEVLNDLVSEEKK